MPRPRKNPTAPKRKYTRRKGFPLTPKQEKIRQAIDRDLDENRRLLAPLGRELDESPTPPVELAWKTFCLGGAIEVRVSLTEHAPELFFKNLFLGAELTGLLGLLKEREGLCNGELGSRLEDLSGTLKSLMAAFDVPQEEKAAEDEE